LEDLQHLLELVTEAGTLTTRSKVQIPQHAITRRLGNEKIAELVAAYQAGQTTIQLMETYQLSKPSVLKLLKANCTPMRHQPITPEQLEQATRLYTTGISLAALSKQLGVPRETIRRGLVDASVSMRQRGWPASASHKKD
jgi:hypothetical protein